MKCRKLFLSAAIAAALTCSLGIAAPTGQTGASVAFAAAKADMSQQAVYEHQGMKLEVPTAYDKLLITETASKDEGILFAVYEKASVEATKKDYPEGSGLGWLFSIGCVSQDKLQEILCGDMSGAELFAKDDKGRCYIFYHPTDVRYMRESPEAMKRDQEQWSTLNAWAWSEARKSFLQNNPGLQEITADNSEVGIYLANILYKNMDYSLTTAGKTASPAKDFSAAPYVEKLLYNVSYQMVDKKIAPKGRFISLNLPSENIRLDFFVGKGRQNLVREVRPGIGECYYEALFADKKLQVSKIIPQWQKAIAAAQ